MPSSAPCPFISTSSTSLCSSCAFLAIAASDRDGEGVGQMTARARIRPDIHERFVTVLARAEAKLKDEQKTIERNLATALAREKREQAAERPPRLVSAHREADSDDEDEPSPIAAIGSLDHA